MKKIALLSTARMIVCILILASTCSLATAQSMKTKVVFKTQLPDSFKDALLDMVRLYENTYSLPDTIIVSSREADQPIMMSGGVGRILANGYHKEMQITSDGLESSASELKSIIAHELFHTLHRKNPYMLQQQVSLAGNNKIIGFYGLSAVVIDAANEATRFTKIEESAAEVCAILGYSDYVLSHPGYAAIASITLSMVHLKWMTTADLIAFQKSPDGFKLFIAKALGIDPIHVRAPEIEYFILLYSNAFNSGEYQPHVINLMKVRGSRNVAQQ